VVALATPGWYTSHDTGLVRSSSDPSGILRSADYAFTIFGLSIDVSYCVAEGHSQGECTNAVDQFRFFDDSKNSEGIKWSRVANGHFADDTRDCDTSSTLLFRGSIISLGMTVVAWGLILATRCYVSNFNWWVMGPAVILVFAAASLMTTIGLRFVLSLDTLVNAMEQVTEEYSGLVEQTVPVFQFGYGLILFICGVLFQWVQCGLMVFLTPPLTSAATLESENRTQERKDRDKRIKKYSQFAVSGEKSLSLDIPAVTTKEEDRQYLASLPKKEGARKVGWSRGIAPQHFPETTEIKQDLELGQARTPTWLMPGKAEIPRRSSCPADLMQGGDTIPGMVVPVDSECVRDKPEAESAEITIDPNILAANARHNTPAARKAQES